MTDVITGGSTKLTSKEFKLYLSESIVISIEVVPGEDFRGKGHINAVEFM